MSRSLTGERGVQHVSDELVARGYRSVIMPPNNRGFDIQCISPNGESFRVEVKCSSSIGTQVPLQVKSHLESSLQRDLFYVIVRVAENATVSPEFYVMTHQEIQAAWDKMPKFKPNGQPYVIGSTGYIDWKHINQHKDKWGKLPDVR